MEKNKNRTSEFKANNKLTHIGNQNCVLTSSGEEEQRPTVVVGKRAEKCVFAQAHVWEGGWTCRCRCWIPALQYGVEWISMQ